METSLDRFSDPDRPRIQTTPINIKTKKGLTLQGQKPHRMSKKSEYWARQKIDDMVEKGHLKEVSNSPLGIPIIMVPKPGTDKMRMVVDMRMFNSSTEKVNLPLPNIEMIFDKLRKIGKYMAVSKMVFTTSQLTKNHRTRLLLSRHGDSIVTLFYPKGGIQVLESSKRSCTKYWTRLRRERIYLTCMSNVDDICVGADTLEELKEKVDRLLWVIYNNGLQVNQTKCVFGATKVKFLGFIVDQDY